MEAVYGKALLFGTGNNLRVGVGLRTKPSHSVFFISNSTPDSSTTHSKPQSRFDKLNANKNKANALILRSKEKIRRRKQAELDENPATASPTRRRLSTHPKGWGDTRVTHAHSHTTSFKSSLPLEDTNFFSLKSFKDIGCADFVIQSLYRLSLTRPSHIQVRNA